MDAVAALLHRFVSYFTYSVGLVASKAMARLVEAEGAVAADRWLNVLKAGGLLKLMELMKLAGLD